MNDVERIMTKNGPCLSSALTSKLVETLGVSEVAARQRVSRGCPSLKKLAYIVFPRKVRFLYLEKDYCSPFYWEALESALFESNSVYGLAYISIEARGGLIPKSHFSIVCGSPLQQKKHISAKTLLDRLISANILVEHLVPGIGECLILKKNFDNQQFELKKTYAELHARIIAESIFLDFLKEWMRNLGLVSYDKVVTRSSGIENNPRVSTFEWDMTAPSYLAPFLIMDKKNNKLNPGFITCDLLLGTVTTASFIKPFVNKCRSLIAIKKSTRFLHFFVAEEYTKEALKEIKSLGAIPATIKNIFGEDTAKTFNMLIALLKDAAILSLDLDKFDAVFKTLSKIEGSAGNLRGALFELFSAELARTAFYADIDLNMICKIDNESAETDVVATVKNKCVYFIECKGYKPTSFISDDEVIRWLTKRIPIVRKWAMNERQFTGLTMNFELWITGKLDEDTNNKIIKAQQATKKYKIIVRNSDDILELLKSTGNKPLTKVFQENFLNNPITKIERSQGKPKKTDDIKILPDEEPDFPF